MTNDKGKAIADTLEALATLAPECTTTELLREIAGHVRRNTAGAHDRIARALVAINTPTV